MSFLSLNPHSPANNKVLASIAGDPKQSSYFVKMLQLAEKSPGQAFFLPTFSDLSKHQVRYRMRKLRKLRVLKSKVVSAQSSLHARFVNSIKIRLNSRHTERYLASSMEDATSLAKRLLRLSPTKYRVICKKADRQDICYSGFMVVLRKMVRSGYNRLFSTVDKFINYCVSVLRNEKNCPDYLKNLAKSNKLQSIYLFGSTSIPMQNSDTSLSKSKSSYLDKKEEKEKQAKEKEEISIFDYLTPQQCQLLVWKSGTKFTNDAVRGLMRRLISRRRVKQQPPFRFYRAEDLDKYIVLTLKAEKSPSWMLAGFNHDEHCIAREKGEKFILPPDKAYWEVRKDLPTYVPKEANILLESSLNDSVSYLEEELPQEQSYNFKGLTNIFANLGIKI